MMLKTWSSYRRSLTSGSKLYKFLYKAVSGNDLNKVHLHISARHHGQPKLSPQEVTQILRHHEFTLEFPQSTNSVKSFDSNQLPSNSPIEDTRSEARCLLTRGMLIGVFDGHGGAACAQVVSKRLPDYICVSLLPKDLLQQYLSFLEGKTEQIDLLEKFNEKSELIADLKSLYHRSFVNYVRHLLSDRKDNFFMEEALERAILQLDQDICSEALESNAKDIDVKTLYVAMSGAVGCVAHIDGTHLHVANVGDCQAVLGVLTEENTWLAKKLTIEHNADNIPEVNRIKNEHPDCEKNTIITQDRLLGQLAPLRAFGDVRYKWSVDVLKKFVVPIFGEEVIAPYYYTPPYLTARPEITHHSLTSRDKFLIIASDGLWDMITPLQAVKLVGEHMRGKVTLNAFRLPNKDMKIGDVATLLKHRKECFNVKPIDRNAATHLFRNVLGGTEYGIEHARLSKLLTLPQDVVRFVRDDITVTVVYFDSEYLRRNYRHEDEN